MRSCFQLRSGIRKRLIFGVAPPQTLSIMREIKRQFDPKGLLNPGRFLAGV